MNDFDYLAQLPGEESEQSWMRERLETLSAWEGAALAAAVQKGPPVCAADAINLFQTLDSYWVIDGTDSYEQLGKRYVDEYGARIPEDARPYVDLTQIGKNYAQSYPGQFLDGCYVMYPNEDLCPDHQGQGAPQTDWSTRLKVASPNVSEGVWIRIPVPEPILFRINMEEKVALQKLHAQSWAECTLLDARCVLPGSGVLMEQYSDIADLIHDCWNLGCKLQQCQTDLQWYDAALQLENCHDLKLALDIFRNADCYHWMPSGELEVFAKQKLRYLSEDIVRSGGIDLRGYGEHLLEEQGYTLTADGSGYIARTSQEFQYFFSTPAPKETTAPQTTEMELM